MPDAAEHQDHEEILNDLAEKVVDSYLADRRTRHLDASFLPSRARVIDIIEILRRVFFPGFFDDQAVTITNVREHAHRLLVQVYDLLHDQIRQGLRYELNLTERGAGDDPVSCDARAHELTVAFLQTLPELRRKLATDVQATFDGDPAAVHTDETVFCYPGLDAIFVYRIAHELNQRKVPMIPRIMTEYAHNETGVDIHPAAQIAESFFIDHATGVVIGETTRIGRNVKIYQGVTLGALSTKGGQEWRGLKRHPTIEDDVTIYPNATILGGSTVIGKGATIGGSVFVTASIPPGHRVTMKQAELKILPPKRRGKKKAGSSAGAPMDFQV